MKKTVGIVVDDYKVDKFKTELTKAGFLDFTITAFRSDCSTIKLSVDAKDVNKVGNICSLVEMHFKQSN